jgi:hypothetical protein
VARVIDRSALTATVEVDELDAPRVRQGQEVRFHFEALPDLDLRGVVASVPVEGRVTDDGVAVIDADLRIDNPPQRVLPGYSFTAEIVIEPVREILVIDRNALSERNGRLVALKAGAPGEPPVPTPVRARDLGDGRYEIQEGLSQGDRVVGALSGSAGVGSAGSAPANPLGIFGIPGGGPPPGGGSRLRAGPARASESRTGSGQ